MPKEAELQKQIIDLLRLYSVFSYRQNTGRRGGVSYGKKGAPDIVAVIGGRYVGIEVKAPDGVVSPDQYLFAEQLEKAGGLYMIARDFIQFRSDIEAIIKKA
jgi:Holliday junction resolvase